MAFLAFTFESLSQGIEGNPWIQSIFFLWNIITSEMLLADEKLLYLFTVECMSLIGMTDAFRHNVTRHVSVVIS